jgi:two-component system, OmpR family, sensor histidine kinase MprB
MSMAARISLLAACAVGLSVSMASLAAYVTLRAQLHDRLDESLLQRANAAAQTDIITQATLERVPPSYLGASDLHIYLIFSDGRVASPDGTSKWVRPATDNEIAVANGALSQSMRTISRDGAPARAVTVNAGDGTALMFVQSTESIERTLDRLGFVLFLVGVGGIVSAAIIGLAVARSALVPVRRLSAAAEHIARTDELKPIAVTGDDELASLASSFNDMVASLAASRERQRRLVADAGHELRTPLTSLRTNLELLAQADRQGGLSPEQRQEIFADATAQVEELSTLVGDLVELARDEPVEHTVEPVDFSDIVARAVDRVRRRGLGLTFDVSLDPWWVMGERQILERAVTNLLDNAAKWSPPHGTVSISLHDGVLEVADEGPGVNEAEMPMIFERFYRSADARTMPGSGLGLSIVKQAVDRHGGWVMVANREPHGARFTMALPGRLESAEPAVENRVEGAQKAEWLTL